MNDSGTRLTSREFPESSTALQQIAWAAIHRPFSPIIWPRASRYARIRPYSRAVLASMLGISANIASTCPVRRSELFCASHGGTGPHKWIYMQAELPSTGNRSGWQATFKDATDVFDPGHASGKERTSMPKSRGTDESCNPRRWAPKYLTRDEFCVNQSYQRKKPTSCRWNLRYRTKLESPVGKVPARCPRAGSLYRSPRRDPRSDDRGSALPDRRAQSSRGYHHLWNADHR